MRLLVKHGYLHNVIIARRLGIDVNLPQPHLPVTEQEQTDVA